MHLLGLILLASGGCIGLVFGVQLFLAAFRVSTWWGLGCLLLPVVVLMFIGTHWSEARKPVLRGLMALALVLLGLTVLRVTAAS